ncbi:hypothetical protein HRD49_28735 [Corallococcus exiguus]|uniref:hypothetical protein n=1 Tax=Corallococcus TaxID=83461 RepID=UPI000EF0934B|nr:MULTISPECIES: hypothetical protein [Corallococcus]NNC19006.1 hypothetical protein [Corallococcus exiguus]NRD65743.1 hypothetical protein [Corallococcus exiguus]RKI13510.1 hypothetical protein D7Y15_16605 [Corallococcus sp. AB030]RUO92159.1 hypothetical protein D7Y11_16130 [Corallococcus sp. AB018]
MSARKFQKASIEELVHWYAEGSIAYEQALEAADSRSANRAQDKVTGAYRELRNRAATSLLLPLLQSKDEIIRSFVATHALEFAPEYGEPVLLWLAARPGPNRTPAKYALKAWREGTLEFP